MPCIASSPSAKNSSEFEAELGAAGDRLAVDAAGEGALAVPLAHRLDLDAGEVLVRPDERRGRDEAAELVCGDEGRRRRVDAATTPVCGLCAATAWAASSGRPRPRSAVGGDGAVTGDVALGLFDVEVVRQAGEAPHVRVLAEPLGQRTHDRLAGEHVATQVLVGDARLDGGEHVGAVGAHRASPASR